MKQFMGKVKRQLAMLLTWAMVLTSLPLNSMTVYAEELGNEQVASETVNAVNDEEIIVDEAVEADVIAGEALTDDEKVIEEIAEETEEIAEDIDVSQAVNEEGEEPIPMPTMKWVGRTLVCELPQDRDCDMYYYVTLSGEGIEPETQGEGADIDRAENDDMIFKFCRFYSKETPAGTYSLSVMAVRMEEGYRKETMDGPSIDYTPSMNQFAKVTDLAWGTESGKEGTITFTNVNGNREMEQYKVCLYRDEAETPIATEYVDMKGEDCFVDFSSKITQSGTYYVTVDVYDVYERYYGTDYIVTGEGYDYINPDQTYVGPKHMKWENGVFSFVRGDDEEVEYTIELWTADLWGVEIWSLLEGPLSNHMSKDSQMIFANWRAFLDYPGKYKAVITVDPEGEAETHECVLTFPYRPTLPMVKNPRWVFEGGTVQKLAWDPIDVPCEYYVEMTGVPTSGDEEAPTVTFVSYEKQAECTALLDLMAEEYEYYFQVFAMPVAENYDSYMRGVWSGYSDVCEYGASEAKTYPLVDITRFEWDEEGKAVSFINGLNSAKQTYSLQVFYQEDAWTKIYEVGGRLIPKLSYHYSIFGQALKSGTYRAILTTTNGVDTKTYGPIDQYFTIPEIYLDTPQNVKYDAAQRKITWDQVDNACQYVVDITRVSIVDGKEEPVLTSMFVYQNSYIIPDYYSLTDDFQYYVQVKACPVSDAFDEGTMNCSLPSDKVLLEPEKTSSIPMPTMKWVGRTLVCELPSDRDCDIYYYVTLSGESIEPETQGELAEIDRDYDMVFKFCRFYSKETPAGTYSLSVRAVRMEEGYRQETMDGPSIDYTPSMNQFAKVTDLAWGTESGEEGTITFTNVNGNREMEQYKVCLYRDGEEKPIDTAYVDMKGEVCSVDFSSKIKEYGTYYVTVDIYDCYERYYGTDYIVTSENYVYKDSDLTFVGPKNMKWENGVFSFVRGDDEEVEYVIELWRAYPGGEEIWSLLEGPLSNHMSKDSQMIIANWRAFLDYPGKYKAVITVDPEGEAESYECVLNFPYRPTLPLVRNPRWVFEGDTLQKLAWDPVNVPCEYYVEMTGVPTSGDEEAPTVTFVSYEKQAECTALLDLMAEEYEYYFQVFAMPVAENFDNYMRGFWSGYSDIYEYGASKAKTYPLVDITNFRWDTASNGVGFSNGGSSANQAYSLQLFYQEDSWTKIYEVGGRLIPKLPYHYSIFGYAQKSGTYRAILTTTNGEETKTYGPIDQYFTIPEIYLDTPQNVKYDAAQRKITWDEVDDANSYMVEITQAKTVDETVEESILISSFVYSNSYIIPDNYTLTDDYQYYVRVKARPDSDAFDEGTINCSLWSELYSLNKTQEPEKTSSLIGPADLVWKGVSFSYREQDETSVSYSFILYCDGTEIARETIGCIGDDSITFNNPFFAKYFTKSGKYKLSCSVTDRKTGETLLVEGVTKDYTLPGEKLADPQNLKWTVEKDALVASWDAVAGAELYLVSVYKQENNQKNILMRSTSKTNRFEALPKIEEGCSYVFDITAITEGGEKVCSATVESEEYVKGALIDSIALNKKEITLRVGEKVRLSYTLLPADVSGLDVQWSGYDEKLVAVEVKEGLASAVVTALGVGKTTVAVAAGGKTSRCTIQILPNQVTLKYNDGVTADKMVDAIVGQPLTILENEVPERAGYLFLGWFTQVDGAGQKVSSDTILKDQFELNAAWMAITSDLIVKPVGDQIYTGTAIKPAVEVFDGQSGTLLKEKVDYTVKYANNIKVNKENDPKPTITITGKGNYINTTDVTFNILPIDIAGEEFVSDNLAVAYAQGKVQKPVPTMKKGSKTLKKAVDYSVAYIDEEAAQGGVSTSNADNGNGKKKRAYEDPGVYRILIKGEGNYSGEKTVLLTITESNLITKAKVNSIPNMGYTGAAVRPELTITYNKKDLVKGVDYAVAYENNVEVGTATAIITGLGSFSGVKRVNYKITGLNISKAVLKEAIADQKYTGMALTPKVKLAMTGMEGELVEGTHYTLSYTKNVTIGKATVTIKGMGAFLGSKKTTTFKIVPETLDNENVVVTCDANAPYRMGGAVAAVKVSVGGKELKAGTDYKLTYANNKTVGATATVTIAGKGNYTGTYNKPVTFTVSAAELKDVTMTVADVVYQGKANNFVSKPVLVDRSGKKLKAGTDYESTVTYKIAATDMVIPDGAIVPSGTVVKAEVKAMGVNYTGTASCEYRVVGSFIKGATVAKLEKTYTGLEIQLTEEDLLGKVTVGKGDAKLILQMGEDKDFVIVPGSYVNNVKKGTAKVTIQGRGYYGGTKVITFKITPKGVKTAGK